MDWGLHSWLNLLNMSWSYHQMFHSCKCKFKGGDSCCGRARPSPPLHNPLSLLSQGFWRRRAVGAKKSSLFEKKKMKLLQFLWKSSFPRLLTKFCNLKPDHRNCFKWRAICKSRNMMNYKLHWSPDHVTKQSDEEENILAEAGLRVWSVASDFLFLRLSLHVKPKIDFFPGTEGVPQPSPAEKKNPKEVQRPPDSCSLQVPKYSSQYTSHVFWQRFRKLNIVPCSSLRIKENIRYVSINASAR